LLGRMDMVIIMSKLVDLQISQRPKRFNVIAAPDLRQTLIKGSCISHDGSLEHPP